MKLKGMSRLKTIFPEPVRNLPRADIPLRGCTAYLSQGETHQVIFMQFESEAELLEHSHAAQWGIVLEGKIELSIGGQCHTYEKGDCYFIPAGTAHSGKIHAGYADITFFAQPDRYQVKS